MKICERCSMKKATYKMGMDHTYLCDECSSMFTTTTGAIPYGRLNQ